MICYVLAMGKQNLGPHVVVAGPFHYARSPDHLAVKETNNLIIHALLRGQEPMTDASALLL